MYRQLNQLRNTFLQREKPSQSTSVELLRNRTFVQPLLYRFEKRCATDRSLLLSGKRLEAGGGTFVGAVSISRTVVLTAVRISRSVNGASRSTATAWRRESRSPLGR